MLIQIYTIESASRWSLRVTLQERIKKALLFSPLRKMNLILVKRRMNKRNNSAILLLGDRGMRLDYLRGISIMHK